MTTGQKKKPRRRTVEVRVYRVSEQEPMMVEASALLERQITMGAKKNGLLSQSLFAERAELSTSTIAAWRHRQRANYMGRTMRKMLDAMGMRMKIVPK